MALTIITYYFLLFYSGLPGDTGIDIMGSYYGFVVLVQCKDWNSRIPVGEIARFEGALSWYCNFSSILSIT